MQTLDDLKNAMNAAQNSIIDAQTSVNALQDQVNQLIAKANTPVDPIDYTEEVQIANATQSRSVTLKQTVDQLIVTVQASLQ